MPYLFFFPFARCFLPKAAFLARSLWCASSLTIFFLQSAKDIPLCLAQDMHTYIFSWAIPAYCTSTFSGSQDGLLYTGTALSLGIRLPQKAHDTYVILLINVSPPSTNKNTLTPFFKYGILAPCGNSAFSPFG